MTQNAESRRLSRPSRSGRHDWIDADAVRDRIDLESVTIALLGPAPGRRGQRGSRRLWWLCPFHQDTNPSFCVTPLKRLWQCFGCGASGDAFQLVMRLKNCDFVEAARWLAGQSGAPVRPLASRGPSKPAPPAKPPSALIDSSSITALVEAAARRLWTPVGKQTLTSLYRRGLTEATIKRAWLGFTPVVTELSDRPAGIVIPWFDGGVPVLVKLRQPDGRRPKYRELFRNRPRLYPDPVTIRADCPLVIVEGEFDALLLGQELGDLAAVVTLGSASGRLDRYTEELLLVSPSWLIATDHDAAGNQAAARWPARARRVVPPDPHKDWTEAHQQGFDLARFWQEPLGLEVEHESPECLDSDAREERAAIMEYDGGLTRAAAERAAGFR
jgi:DNA primase